ncbi:MAG: phosphoribosylformylglycinamidine synthase subunit PurS [Phycisphaerales bacterium]
MSTLSVHRFEVRVRSGEHDPAGEAIERDATAIGLGPARVRTASVYLVEGALDSQQLEQIRTGLLVDPVVEEGVLGAAPAGSAEVIEVHPLPGVMDPVAMSVESAIERLTGVRTRVSTGRRYNVEGLSRDDARRMGERLLANTVIQRVETAPFHPAAFPRPQAHDARVRTIALTGLDDAALQRLSREAHLFLSLDEMRALQAEYRRQGREPREIELETLAQTWSEHCVHKTLKSRVRYSEPGAGVNGGAGAGAGGVQWSGRPGTTVHADGSVTIDNLLKNTVAAATYELIADGVDWALSVFKDNSGVVALDDRFGVCIKVETHNHPSAIEPYGGAATGAGGCIRDVMGTGLGARPIANTDVFCVAPPGHYSSGRAGEAGAAALPPGCLPPERVLRQVVAGVRDYGNRMGIPTVNGAVHVDPRYVGNPLVFCGCIGLIPRDRIKGRARPGDRIIALGGRTGRDGIHGATFSSTELEHTSADEFSHAVQIGNAIEEKRVLDALLRARDENPAGPLYHAITDCGAGGFSSAVGEMGAELGATVHLDRAPLKYSGLSPVEIWISEAQERMVLAVPEGNLAALRRICAEESVELADLGTFGTPNAELVLLFGGAEMGRLSMHFLHEGIPMPEREARYVPPVVKGRPDGGVGAAVKAGPVDAGAALVRLLRHPTIASKHWVVRQYDHEVRGDLVLKPLVGPLGRGPGDASVLEPIAGSGRGIAIGCGLQTPLGDRELGGDPYVMTLAAIDECVRNLVCVGADPQRIAILDNFCWPSCGKPENMGTLVRAAAACYDGAKAYRTPFVSGKDSLNNQLTIPAQGGEPARTIEIPPTLLITGLGIVPAIDRCVSMDAKRPGNLLVLVGETGRAMGCSHYAMVHGLPTGAEATPPRTDLGQGPRNARAVAGLIRAGVVRSAHDCSEGGAAVALAEMLIAGSTPARPIGARLALGALRWDGQGPGPALAALFAETPSRYLLEIDAERAVEVARLLEGVPHAVVGEFNASGRLTVDLAGIDASVEELAAAWREPLDW